jgi:hypothetical protein
MVRLRMLSRSYEKINRSDPFARAHRLGDDLNMLTSSFMLTMFFEQLATSDDWRGRHQRP